MRFASGQIQQSPWSEFLCRLANREDDTPFQTLHGDLAGSLVQWNVLACGENQPDQLQIGGFHQGRRLGTAQGNVHTTTCRAFTAAEMDKITERTKKELA